MIALRLLATAWHAVPGGHPPLRDHPAATENAAARQHRLSRQQGRAACANAGQAARRWRLPRSRCGSGRQRPHVACWRCQGNARQAADQRGFETEGACRSGAQICESAHASGTVVARVMHECCLFDGASDRRWVCQASQTVSGVLPGPGGRRTGAPPRRRPGRRPPANADRRPAAPARRWSALRTTPAAGAAPVTAHLGDWFARSEPPLRTALALALGVHGLAQQLPDVRPTASRTARRCGQRKRRRVGGNWNRPIDRRTGGGPGTWSYTSMVDAGGLDRSSRLRPGD